MPYHHKGREIRTQAETHAALEARGDQTSRHRRRNLALDCAQLQSQRRDDFEALNMANAPPANIPLRNIPHEDDDPIMRLLTHYFEPTDLLRSNYLKLENERQRRGKLSQNKERDLAMFFRLWLATLFVLVEGFQHKVVVRNLERWRKAYPDINVYCSSIQHMSAQLGDELRGLRNDAFHFNPTPTMTLKFLEAKPRNPPTLGRGASKRVQEFLLGL